MVRRCPVIRMPFSAQSRSSRLCLVAVLGMDRG
jgi:hypothetical protein